MPQWGGSDASGRLLYNLSMIELGRYRHYKGGEYEVIATGLMESSHEPVVVYRSLGQSGEFPAGTVWVRPVAELEEIVEGPERAVSRFVFLDN